MTGGWQSKLARISAMDGREVRVRACQEMHKRRDLLLHKLGIRQDLRRTTYKSSGRGGKFFFSAADARTRAGLLQQSLPSEVTEILREADDICGHKFRLLGYEGLTFNRESVAGGSGEIDWHFDAVHQKRAPLVPWFTIPFLDFSVVGDHKVTWELNRHQHLVTLAKAALLSGQPVYVNELISQWRSWIQANSYPLGINWGSSLEVAFRSLSWIWIDQLLAGAGWEGGKHSVAEFRADLIPALAFQGRYIEKYLSTYFSPNTHLLGEGVALFFLGTLFPEMPHAAGWKETGWAIVLDAARRQVRPDGVYFEQSFHYHVYALDFFLHARLLAERNAIAIPSAFDATLQKMLDVVEAQAQAGVAEGFGDDDGGRLFNPRRNRSEQLTDPLALGALIYDRNSAVAQLTEESIWLFGEKIDRLSTRPIRSTVRSQVFPDGGVYVLADSQPFPQVMTVDAGPQGVGRSGHGHADALSVRLTMNGRRWLVDSGSNVYIAKDKADRDTFRGTGAHNTLRVDGQDQAVADEAFSWTHIPAPRAETWIVGETFSYFVGSHNGYERLSDPVTHSRHVLTIAGDLWLVRDVAIGDAEHQIEIRWHFAPDLEVRSLGDGQIDIAPKLSSSGPVSDTALSLIVPHNGLWKTTAETTGTVISPAYGALRAAPLVRSASSAQLPIELATVLIPRLVSGSENQNAPSRSHLALTSMRQVEVQDYELTDADGTHGFFFALGENQWSSGPWSSDAQLLYCRIEHERIVHLVVIGGTEVAWKGQSLMKAQSASDFFEWRARDAVIHRGSFSLTDLFEVLTDRSASSSPRSIRDLSSFVEKH